MAHPCPMERLPPESDSEGAGWPEWIPDSRERLANWDVAWAGRLRQSACRPRLDTFFSRMVMMTSDYSGWDAPREAMRIFAPQVVANPDVQFVRSCDWGSQQHKVLCVESTMFTEGSNCVFRDMQDRMHEKSRKHIAQLAPGKSNKMPLKEAVRNNQMIEEFLLKNRGWAVPIGASSWCSMHQQCCPVNPLWLWREMRANSSEAHAVLAQRQQDVPEPWWVTKIPPSRPSLGGDLPATGPPAKRFKKSCTGLFEDDADFDFPNFDFEADDVQEPRCISVSGLTCTDWCLGGKKTRFGGVSEQYHAAWLADRMTCAEYNCEDVSFSECSSKYPVVEKQLVPLKETHTTVFVKVCPSILGFPSLRERTFAANVAQGRQVWVGPSDKDDIMAAFLKFYGATCSLTGEVYLQADLEELKEMVRCAVRRRRKALPPSFESTFNGEMEDLLVKMCPPGAVQRKVEHETHRLEFPKEKRFLFSDIDHHAGKGPLSTGKFPVMLTHGSYWNYSQKRFASRKEEFSAQGVDMYESLAGKRGISPMAAVFADLDDRHQQVLNGNAIHVPAFAAWMMFVLGNIMPVEAFHQMSPMIKNSDAADDSNDAQEEEEEEEMAAQEQ